MIPTLQFIYKKLADGVIRVGVVMCVDNSTTTARSRRRCSSCSA